jgi:hypothetical protein
MSLNKRTDILTHSVMAGCTRVVVYWRHTVKVKILISRDAGGEDL